MPTSAMEYTVSRRRRNYGLFGDGLLVLGPVYVVSDETLISSWCVDRALILNYCCILRLADGCAGQYYILYGKHSYIL